MCQWCGNTPCSCKESNLCPICDEGMGEFCCMTCGLTWDMYDDAWDDRLTAENKKGTG